MQTVTFELQTDIANKMNNIIQLFGTKEIMFHKFIEYSKKNLKREIALMQSDLNKYEEKYKMQSIEFFEKFENGLLGDSKEFIIWSGIYEMQLNCKEKLNKLL